MFVLTFWVSHGWLAGRGGSSSTTELMADAVFPLSFPVISLGELKYADLGEVIGQGNSPFQPCAPYIDQFYQVAQQYGIPPILIASIAMQESTCNPSVTGGGGEQGMFQISQDKCGGAPGGNCKDVVSGV